MDSEEEEDSHSFGQKVPPLYVEIKGVLQEYPDGQVFKEIIQNADDAGARTVRFYLDSRQHGTRSLVHPKLARFQGPALLAYNDAEFTPEDWKGIQSFKISGKKEDPFKVGKFGIGFNSVYHITDLPIILSGKTLAFLEPHQEVWKGESGRKFVWTARRRHFKDSLGPFCGICGFSTTMSTYAGTLFRFPLRDTPSKLSDNVYTVEKLRTLTDALKSDAKLLLLFLRSVDTIEVHEIGRTGRAQQVFRVAISDRDRAGIHRQRTTFIQSLRTVHSQQSYSIREPVELDLTFHVEVTSGSGAPTLSHWLVVNQVGSTVEQVCTAARKQQLFPWVGAALELTEHPSRENGRVFCFLPLPSDASSHLPVHVNGTFGLTSNRRTLKWPGSEARNDQAAQWNELLVRHLVPPCYKKLLVKAKQHLTVTKFYQAWPNVSSVRYTPWENLLEPLFQQLLCQTNLWVGPPLNQWVSPQQAVFIPEDDSNFPQVVKRTLAACRVKLVSIPPVIWEAIHYSPMGVSPVTPSFTRQTIRGNVSSYNGFGSTEKQNLLSYCLSDSNYSDLQGLALLPLADGSFASFQSQGLFTSNVNMYICTKDIPRDLLPNLDHLLVDLSDENPDLHCSLMVVASLQRTQLQCLSAQTVACLLPSCMPAGWWSKSTVSLPSGSFPLKWIQVFWEWMRVHRHQLQLFDKQLLVPISTGHAQRKFDVSRLSRDSAVVYLPTSASCHPDLRQALTKLQVRITDQSDFPYVSHPQLMNYLYKYTADDVLSAVACTYRGRRQHIQATSLTGDEASMLLLFLSSLSYELDHDQKRVLYYLPIFTAVQQRQLFSIKKAAEQSWGGEAIVQPQALDISHSCLPPNLVLLSRSKQLSLLTDSEKVETPNQLQFILNTLYPMIRNGDYPDSKIDQLMTEILRLIPVLNSQLNRSQSDNLVSVTGNLRFIRTSDGTRKSPHKLFDPSIPDLKALYQGEPVFPKAPFTNKEFHHCLLRCGLRNSVSAQQVVSIIESICLTQAASPVAVEKAKFCRAKAVLKYLSSCSERFFSEKVTIHSGSEKKWCSFIKAISTLSYNFNWLPVCPKPPGKFPSYLTWKGRACTNHFACLSSEVLLPTSDNSNLLPCITGSQMYVIDCAISPELYDQLTSFSSRHRVTNGQIAEHVWNHFKLVIKHHREMKPGVLGKIACDVYEYLEKYGGELRELDVASWIWIRKHHTFVCPTAASLKEHPTFPHSLEPYLYVIPETLVQDYSKLFTRHGAQEEVSQSQIVSVLGKIKARERADVDGGKALSMVINILKWLTNNGKEAPRLEDGRDLYVPVQTTSSYPQLVKPDKAVYGDSAFLQQFVQSSDLTGKYAFVEQEVGVKLACVLGVIPLSQHLHISEDTFEDVGQHEPLITRLKNILEDYRDGVTIVKELLQNADDAGATEFNICYDARTHTAPPKSLFYAGMAQSHGPALVVHNNASFSKEDFLNITKLAGETKMNKPLKIGKFGVGFCSVYHITDIPSFVSQDMLYIFDPTMSHLGKEIRDSARPGKKIRFTDEIIVSSKQLKPYEGLYGFDKRTLYNGTIFRFPFRTKPSEISGEVYKKSTVMKLLEDIRCSSSHLILFLRSVKKVTVSQIKPGECTPTVVFSIQKRATVLQARFPASILSFVQPCQRSPSSLDKEHWLVASHSDENVDFGLYHTYATASVACQLTLVPSNSTSSPRRKCYMPKAIPGGIFCFLPLAVYSGLPVHVSSNFAVMKSRRGIQASSDSSDRLAKFNVGLMEHIVSRAYCNLLETLQSMCIKGQIPQESYQFFSLWPLKEELRTHNPWDKLIAPLYELISSSELFFSGSVNQWLTLSQCELLAPGILSTRSDLESIPSCVATVLEILQHRFVDLPERCRTHLPQLEQSILNERRFVEIFFTSVKKLEHNQNTRNQVLKHLLRTFGDVCSQESTDDACRQEYLEKILGSNQCVPCTPDGTVLKHCKDVVDPSASLSKLYDQDDHIFPVREFCKNRLIHGALCQLGMVRYHMPWHMLAERARTVQILFRSEQTKTKALERAQLIIECINKKQTEDSFNRESGPSGEDDCKGLDSIPFLPVMKSPKDYPLQWCGDGCELLSGKELIHSGQKNVRLAGSQLPVVCDKNPKNGGCGTIPSQVREILKVRDAPDCTTVIKQLYCLFSKFKTQRSTQISPHSAKGIEEITSAIYNYLNKAIDKGTVDPSELKRLKCRQCVWTGDGFVSPSTVAKNWSHRGPYLYGLPHTMRDNTKLAVALSIRDEFAVSDFVSALKNMSEDFPDQSVSGRCLKSILVIVQELDTQTIPEGTEFYLPDENLVMCLSTELVYNDAPWCQKDEEWRLVHRTIPRDSAVKLGVKPVRRKFLEQYESPTDSFTGVPFGQRELLTQRIKNILSQYPCDETVLKELLQNADDAKATKMYVILDKRTHGKDKIPSEEWADLQGPALLVWNDSVFTEKDLQGIQELGLGSKRTEEESIGQYGIGFNVVYNITDCPSFITHCSGETLCVLDPHCRYVPGASTLKPGRRYDRLDDRFWSSYADLTTAYLREGVRNCPPELTTWGSLFRFPLRSTKELVEKSELVDRGASKGTTYSTPPTLQMTACRMQGNISEWAFDIKRALFFLNHVTEIRFFTIEDNNKMLLTNWYEATLDEEAQAKRAELHSRVTAFVKAEQVPHVVCYPLTLTERSAGMYGKRQVKVSENWLIQQGVGDLLNPDQEWRYAPQVKPKHGIAAPLRLTEGTREFRGTVFCFLPLPLSSRLPVHVNGNFILDSSRRDLWHSTREDDPDDRTKWNKRLINAIASSYAKFLSNSQHFFVDRHCPYYDIKELFGSVNMYYSTFPTWLGRQPRERPEGLLHFLAQTVYRALERKNAHIMATIKKGLVRAIDSGSPAASSRASPRKVRRSPQAKFSVVWHPLHNEEQPSKQTYFWRPHSRSDKELRVIFESVGMELSVAPMFIRAHFTDIGIDLPEATRDTVFRYYSHFHSQVSHSGDFPCHIADTVFRSVDRFQSFSQFLLTVSSESEAKDASLDETEHPISSSSSSLAEGREHKEFPSDPFSLPLLLTADQQLRCFEKSNLVFCSPHHKSFPHSKDKFLNPALLSMQYTDEYFVQVSDQNWPKVRDILHRELPESLETERGSDASSHIKRSDLHRLWGCLAEDDVFGHHLDDIMKMWALLLTTQSQLFAFRSWDQLLPIVAPREQKDQTFPSEDDQYLPVFKVLQEAGMPVLDTSVVPRATASKYCPTFSHPQRILTSLYHLHKVHMEQEGLSQLFPERNADRSISTLFEYFKGIHFAQDDDSLRKLKCLPLFKDVSGQLRTLEGKAYIWPPHICKAGSSKWLSETTAVFLKKDGAWTRLGVDAATVLGVEEIPVIKVYSEFIFPCFQLLSAEERYAQLKDIRDQLFDDADSEKKSKDKSKSSAAQRFINDLKELSCLPLPDGKLRPVKDFSDPEISIFYTFRDSFSFPPDQLCSTRWLVFLREIGLRKKVSQDQFEEFCRKVSAGEHRELRKASKTLLKYLLKASEWYSDHTYLAKVSNIPFVLTDPLPSLDWIKPVCPAQNMIQQGTETMHLTCLHGAGLYQDCRKLIWTVKPVVNLPSFAEDTKPETKTSVKEHLSVITKPHPRDVVDNLKNISESRFANFELFDKYTDDCKPKQEQVGSECLLVKVVEEHFRFLQTEGCDHLVELLDPLKDVHCIPVCTEGKLSGIRRPVLVKPLQVVASADEELQKARPFINPLPHTLFNYLQEVLLKLGVETTMQPKHVRVALETIHSHIRQPLDPNTIEVMQYLLKRLYFILKDSGPAACQKYSDMLTPLYLPNVDGQLVDSTRLICIDKRQYRKTAFDFRGLQYSLLDFLVANPGSELGFTPSKLCTCLPTSVSPLLLSNCSEEQLHPSCDTTVSNTLTASNLQRTFGLYVYIIRALELILQHAGQAVAAEESSKFIASLQEFLQKTEIVVYRNLRADLYLTLVTPKQKIGTADVRFLIQKTEEETYRLCLNHDTSSLKYLANSIVSCVARSSGVNPQTIGSPEEAIEKLLQAQSPEEIEELLEDMDIQTGDLALGNVDIPFYSQKPKLGDPIPPQWHDLLDQDINNVFRPEELVGYEERDDHIVLARVICRMPSEEEEEEEEGEGERIVQYLIRTGEEDEEGKRVSVLDLYKFKRTDSTSLEDSREVAIPEDTDATRLMTSLHDQGGGSEWRKIKREICTDLQRVWNLPEDEKRKGIKRLYLKWHPDKNDHPLATKAFQFLKQQISRLEAGLPLDEGEDEDEDYHPPSSWTPWWNKWDDIAAQHRRARRRGGRGGGGGAGGIDMTWLGEMTPSQDLPTARVWLQQAEVDMRVLRTVLAQVGTCPDHSAHVCFLAHEVAEKALKAGKYATSGLHSSSLRFHDLVQLTRALEQSKPHLTIGLSNYANGLEKYYLRTRFPNKYTPPSVPADHFSPDQARDAHRIAEKILQMMREVVGQAREN